MTKDKAIEIAKRNAMNGARYAVFNLNTVGSALYVIRELPHDADTTAYKADGRIVWDSRDEND